MFLASSTVAVDVALNDTTTENRSGGFLIASNSINNISGSNLKDIIMLETVASPVAADTAAATFSLKVPHVIVPYQDDGDYDFFIGDDDEEENVATTTRPTVIPPSPKSSFRELSSPTSSTSAVVRTTTTSRPTTATAKPRQRARTRPRRQKMTSIGVDAMRMMNNTSINDNSIATTTPLPNNTLLQKECPNKGSVVVEGINKYMDQRRITISIPLSTPTMPNLFTSVTPSNTIDTIDSALLSSTGAALIIETLNNNKKNETSNSSITVTAPLSSMKIKNIRKNKNIIININNSIMIRRRRCILLHSY